MNCIIIDDEEMARAIIAQMIPNQAHGSIFFLVVVNCFQNCILAYNSQHDTS